MELNKELVRYVMIELEEHLIISATPAQDAIRIRPLTLPEISKLPNLEVYDFEDVAYSVIKLIEAGMLIGQTKTPVLVSDITYAGHEFLQNIKDDNVWKQVKSIATSVASSVSVGILADIAKNCLLGGMIP